MFEISATIDGGFGDPDVLCAFDPTKVVARLRREFPGTEVDSQDYAWRVFDQFVQRGLVDESGTLGVAARDARRRGPIWLFRVRSDDGACVRGGAERHRVWFYNDDPFPEPLRSKLLAFVDGLRFAPCVSVKCARVEDNDESPA